MFKLGYPYFFIFSCVTIILLHVNLLILYLSSLSMAALSLICQDTVALKKSFTLQYARGGADPALVASAPFIQANYIITGMWEAFCRKHVRRYCSLLHSVPAEIRDTRIHMADHFDRTRVHVLVSRSNSHKLTCSHDFSQVP